MRRVVWYSDDDHARRAVEFAAASGDNLLIEKASKRVLSHSAMRRVRLPETDAIPISRRTLGKLTMDPQSAWVLGRVIDAARRIALDIAEPWNTRRAGRARADVRAYQKLRDEQTRKDIEAIRRGEATLGPRGKLVALLGSETKRAVLPAPGIPADQPVADAVALAVGYDLQLLLTAAQDTRTIDDVNAHLNLRATVRMAEEEAERITEPKGSMQPPNAATVIEDDWLGQWRRGAEQASDEQIQALWARLLVDEAANPGSFSFRTMAILRQMGHREANKFAQLGPYVINGSVFARAFEYYQTKGITLPIRLRQTPTRGCVFMGAGLSPRLARHRW